MKITQRYYPYPVLTYFDDSIIGSFDVINLSAVLDADKENYTLKGEFFLENSDLIKLIEQDEANFVLHIECPKTRFRKPYLYKEEEFELKLPTQSIDGKVEIQPAIISKKTIEKYNNSSAHNDYHGLNFTIKTGDTLAVAEPLEFTASKSLDSLKNFPSIFSISKNVLDPEKSMDIDFEANRNKIQILLSEKNYSNFRACSQDSQKEPILAAMILLPALLTLFRDFNENIEEYEGYKWFAAIKRRIEECGYDFENISWENDALELSHKVIGDALKKGLNFLADGV
ncbi:hypothetical protein QUF84_09090 [Fictibacillus enclensis]|uniref:hypothetical protein n=1 Tax=Fictibacillus enclensis TaxID=1017270 RepID=UPI0025A2D3BC|nr:hypothetical protein [Fictibacillus enclensis]MDM5337368.1 hypothetical protein [Fictibacillus enclensis]